MRILIAEDDSISRMILARVLENLGHEVVAVTDGSQAWQVMQGPDAPRLAIFDWMMPGLDGLQVVGRIRERESDRRPYLIMLTSKTEKEAIVTGLDAGADDYLGKPFDPDELRARIGVGQRMIDLQDALIASRDQVRYEATHDPLTGLLNRRAILAQLRKELSRSNRHAERLAVGMCDLDHFKQVNDVHGHQTGDEVLTGFAQILVEGVRSYDSVGRLGGEEFLVILPLKGDTNGEAAFGNLCRRVATKGIPTRAGILSISVSIGAVCSTPESTVDALLEASDQAMYRAKHGGRNRVAFLTQP